MRQLILSQEGGGFSRFLGGSRNPISCGDSFLEEEQAMSIT